jgi:hypothetical protein
MKTHNLVSNKWRGFFTGHAGDRQIITGFEIPGLLALSFDKEGKLVKAEGFPFSPELLDEWAYPPYDGKGNELRRKGLIELRSLQQRIGFVEGAISVQEFSTLPNYNAYLTELPIEYREDDPDQVNDEEEIRDQIDAWRSLGQFAFCWDVEYYMNADGTINTY